MWASATQVIPEESIPIIDISNWEDPKVAKPVCDASEKWGFFQIMNHAVPIQVLENVQDTTHRFFGLPAEEKNKYSKEHSASSNVRFGTSFSPKAEKALEWKDFLSLFLVSEEESCAFWPPVCRTNLNYYPICFNPELTVGVGRHSDVSSLSILLQDEIGGLYVKGNQDALQIPSNGRYRSVENRVIASGSKNRISVPIFVNPRPGDIIGPLPQVLENGEKPIYKQVLYSDYVRHFFRKAHDGKKTVEFAEILIYICNGSAPFFPTILMPSFLAVIG
ncbi:Leucoanthocyanidin dioxygenase, putative [Theobroma cacao]|uniref:Leucoanthocyanidin dioxygenase, putative n=1 Tax=Theobroma cacao TaxID=3641 RepID=A0A061GS28_THECC|nr:Leucoanthocyanidin dioxygenase, putative [Theobroma cacao]